jgi:hypothetical protein
MNLFTWVAEVTARWVGIPPDLLGFQPAVLLGVRGIAPVFASMQPAASVFQGLGFVFLLFLLSLLPRSGRRAAAGLWLLFMTAMLLEGQHPYILPFMGARAAAHTFVNARFGLLALSVAPFVFFMVEFYPYTTDPSAWYAGVTLFAASVIVAIAVYGFRVSLGGRALFRRGLLED